MQPRQDGPAPESLRSDGHYVLKEAEQGFHRSGRDSQWGDSSEDTWLCLEALLLITAVGGYGGPLAAGLRPGGLGTHHLEDPPVRTASRVEAENRPRSRGPALGVGQGQT